MGGWNSALWAWSVGNAQRRLGGESFSSTTLTIAKEVRVLARRTTLIPNSELAELVGQLITHVGSRG